MATHTFRLGAPGSPEITVVNDPFRGARAFAGTRPLERRRERGRPYFVVPLADGTERPLIIAGSVTGLRAIAGDEEIQLERRLAPWELLLAFLPLALLTFGLVGGLLGGAGTATSLWVARRPWSTPVRVAAMAGVLVGAFAVWFAVVRLITA